MWGYRPLRSGASRIAGDSNTIAMVYGLLGLARIHSVAAGVARDQRRSAMRAYGSKGGGSGVVAYDAGPDWIVLRFVDGGTYRYDRRHPGPCHVAEMQRLAEAGRGLNTYLNQHVREDYAARLE